MRVFGMSKSSYFTGLVFAAIIGLSGYAMAASDSTMPTHSTAWKADGKEYILAMDQTTGQAVDDVVDPDRAAQDPVVYLLALDTIRAYFWAGLTAYQNNELDTAGGMFKAPMEDIYVNLEPYLDEQGAPAFKDALSEASDVVFMEKSQSDMQAAIDSIFSALTNAESITPKSEDSSEDSQADVLADLLVRAATQYNAAFGSDGTDRTWLNGYGFYKAAQYRASVALPLLSQQNAEVHSAFLKAMELLDQAYKSTARPVIAPIRESSVVDSAQKAADLLRGQ